MAIYKKIQPYLVVFSAALFFLFEFINMNSFDSLNQLLRQAFHVDAFQISNLSAMYFYANVLFLIPAGVLLDRMSPKRLLQFALIFCILGNVVFATTHHFDIAKVCRFVIGMGSTLVLLAPAVLTVRWIPPKQAGLVMGLIVSFAMLGGSIAQQIPYVIDWLGSWRFAVLAIAVLGVLFLVIITLFVQDYPDHAALPKLNHSASMRTDLLKNLFLTLQNKQVWLGGCYSSLINLTVMILGALWGAEYLEVAHGVAAKQASFIVTLIFFGFILGGPLFGVISDRLERRKSPMIAGGLLNLVCILVILHSHVSPEMLAGLFFLLGALSGAQILTFPLIMESVPLPIVASSESVSAVLIMGGGALFQPLFGFLLNHFSGASHVYAPAAFQRAIWILPITFLIATLLSCFLRETYCKRIGGI